MRIYFRSLTFLFATLIAIGSWWVFAGDTPSDPSDDMGPAVYSSSAASDSSDDAELANTADHSEVDSNGGQQKVAKTNRDEEYVPKTKRELARILSPIQYNVTQNEGTEPAFRNRYWDNKQEGVYKCIVCGLDLFSSETKYRSGTGWPSYYAPINARSVGTRKDWHLIYERTEVHCSRCNSHLGHVFDDGPQPTGKRYCMNSAALKFAENGKEASRSDVKGEQAK